MLLRTTRRDGEHSVALSSELSLYAAVREDFSARSIFFSLDQFFSLDKFFLLDHTLLVLKPHYSAKKGGGDAESYGYPSPFPLRCGSRFWQAISGDG